MTDANKKHPRQTTILQLLLAMAVLAVMLSVNLHVEQGNFAFHSDGRVSEVYTSVGWPFKYREAITRVTHSPSNSSESNAAKSPTVLPDIRWISLLENVAFGAFLLFLIKRFLGVPHRVS